MKTIKTDKDRNLCRVLFCRNGSVRLGSRVEKTNRSLSKSTQLKPSPSSKEGLEVRSPHCSALDKLKTILIKKIKPCLSDVSTLFSQGEEKTKER